MTREQALEMIRAACIAANPDRDWEYNIYRSEDGTKPELVIDAVRLADVLLALQSRRKVNISENDNWEHQDALLIWGYWSLCANDLNEQTDETINFIYDLLK